MKKFLAICLLVLFLFSTTLCTQASVALKDSTRWKITNAAGQALQGYASNPSYEVGQTIKFFIHNESPFYIEFYRMGYNNGLGSRYLGKTGIFKGNSANKQPKEDVVEAGWKPSATYRVPSTWESGMYFAKLIDSQKRESYIPIVIRDKQPKAQLGILLATNTYQAYNSWGGKSMYGYNSSHKVHTSTVSYLRPYKENNGSGEFLQYEYNFVRWIERQNYTVTYFTDKDIHNGILKRSNIDALIIPGHNEYWTMKMRNEIDDFSKTPKKGVALLNANTGFWQARYNGNKMICYKALPTSPVLDPIIQTNPKLATTLFRLDPVNMPENQLFGTMYVGIPAKDFTDLPIVANHWLLKGTSLKVGSVIPQIVGGEIDGVRKKNGITSPKNVEIIGETVLDMQGHNQKGTSTLSWYKNPQGGKVFAVGTFYWNWALDPYGKTMSMNKDVQIITKNALEALTAH